MTMTLHEIIAEMRAYEYQWREPAKWANALEAAMREPVAYRVDEVDVAGNRAASSLSWTSVPHSDRPDLMPRNIPLYAMPPNAHAEIERLTEERDVSRLEFELLEEVNGKEFERLREALTELERYADDSIGSQYGTLCAKMVRDIARAALAGKERT